MPRAAGLPWLGHCMFQLLYVSLQCSLQQELGCVISLSVYTTYNRIHAWATSSRVAARCAPLPHPPRQQYGHSKSQALCTPQTPPSPPHTLSLSSPHRGHHTPNRHQLQQPNPGPTRGRTWAEQEQTQAAGSSNRQPHLPVKQPHRLRSGQKDFRMLHSCGSSCELISQGEWAFKAIVALSACAGPREMLGSFLILHVAPSWSL